MRKFKLPQNVSVAIWLVLVPALLFGLGLWQAERAAETTVQSQALSAQRPYGKKTDRKLHIQPRLRRPDARGIGPL